MIEKLIEKLNAKVLFAIFVLGDTAVILGFYWIMCAIVDMGS